MVIKTVTKLVLQTIQPTIPLNWLAHQTEIGGSIGVTHHIEPNDAPRAGEPSTAWFLLTQRGGTEVPLAACDCQLAVYGTGQGTTQEIALGATPIATPTLKAIASEGHQEVPAATLTFPTPGLYRLVLQGQPKTQGTFEPFQVEFSVTVAEGRSPQTTAIATPSPSETPLSNAPPLPSSTPLPSPAPVSHLGFWGPAIALGITLTALGALARQRWRK